jgi:hypothetical protein
MDSAVIPSQTAARRERRKGVEVSSHEASHDYRAGLLAPAGTPSAVIDKLNRIGADSAPNKPKEFDE